MKPRQRPIGARDRKVIQYGFGMKWAEHIRKYIHEMESQPFQGVVFTIRQSIGPGVAVPNAFDIRDWSDEDLVYPVWKPSDLEILRSIPWNKFVDNFLALDSTNYFGMDWFSDGHWKFISENMKRFAAVARSAGIVGIFFDTESYCSHSFPGWPVPQCVKFPFSYLRIFGRDCEQPERTFDEVSRMVRQRGRQWLEALQSEMNPRILMTHLMHLVALQLAAESDKDPKSVLEESDLGLLPAFLEGMLDAAKRETRIIDGQEQAYFYDDTEEFFQGHNRIKAFVDVHNLVLSRDVHDKYRRNVEVSVPIYATGVFNYLDVGDPDNPCGGDHPKFTEEYCKKWWKHNVYHALSATDEYVWAYDERIRWWDETKGISGAWDWEDCWIPGTVKETISTASQQFFSGEPLGFDLWRKEHLPILGPAYHASEPAEIVTRPSVRIIRPASDVVTAGVPIVVEATATVEPNLVGPDWTLYVDTRPSAGPDGSAINHGPTVYEARFSLSGPPEGFHRLVVKATDARTAHHGISGSVGIQVYR